MSEERTRILRLLEEGKITADQAARLIEALGQARSDDEPGFPPIPPIPPIPPLRRTYLRRHGMAGIDQIPDIVAKAVSSAVRTSRVTGETVRRFEGVKSLVVKTVSGDVEVAGTSETGGVVTSDGNPRVSESGGALDANAVSDDVGARVPRAAEVTIKTVSGDVAAAQLDGPLSAVTVSGDVEAVEASAGVHAVTVSGDVELTRVAGELAIETRSGGVDIVPGGALWGEVAARSGDVTLLVRPDADLLLELETEDGEIDVDLEAAHETVEATDQRRQVKLGAGSKTLKVRTVSGDITVRDDSEEQ